MTLNIRLRVGISLLAALCTAGSSSALTTVPTIFLDEPPLLISSYQRSVDGKRLAFVQLYNDGDAVLNLADWRIMVSGGDVSFSFVSGFLAPQSHVVASVAGGVEGASVLISDQPEQTDPKNAHLIVTPPPSSNYKTVDYALKFQTTTISPKIDVFHDIWRRSLTTTGYSSVTTSFNVFSETELFDDGLYRSPEALPVEIEEIYPYASDCAPDDAGVLCGDFIKLHNTSAETIVLDDFVLRTDSSSATRTSANTISLDGVEIAPGGYYLVRLTDASSRLSLTNSGGYIWLEDTWGLKTYDDSMTKYESAGSEQQGMSWVQKDDDSWGWTSTPQPFAANQFTEILAQATTAVAECPVGKYRNPETNRCRTIEEAVNALAVCPEGQTRNPDTNRCRSVTVSASLMPCGEGHERNPATNRCRSIASAVAELIPCDEGYERNPATNRCRKSNPLASGAVPGMAAASTSAGSQLSNGYLLAGIVAVGAAGYGIYEWRPEILAAARRLAGAISGKK